ncbi:fatty acid desaturase family protein [Aestuariivivens sediminicola]|uniref:fatty acid desaturase family protein n=1 Tax=Aestuariivivens sediminicola TaxID=2913560 RepID=UPI001F57B203|nr:acyl-CoA desaturase [Aestuariivivens sediminicola]
MEGIKFVRQNSKEREFASEVRRRVRTYFKENNKSIYGNFNMYVKSAVILCIYVVPFIILLTRPVSQWTGLFLAVIMGVGEAGVGMSIMHDGVHQAYSSKKWVNNLASSTMLLLGSNIFNWKIQHNLKHHTFTNIYNYDPDISNLKIIRLSKHGPLRKYHRYQHLYAFPLYGLMTFVRLFGEIGVLLEYNRKGITKQQNLDPRWQLVKLIGIKIIYFAVIIGLPLLFTDFVFWEIIVGFIALHVTAGMIMSTVFQMAHVVEGTDQILVDKDHQIKNDWLVHQLHVTSDFGRRNGVLSWYIGGLDFQIEHHLFQNICHVHYAAIASIVQNTAKEYGIIYNLKSNIFSALASHFRRLKELGREAMPLEIQSG